MKEAYVKQVSEWGWNWAKCELTGLCKKVEGGAHYGQQSYQCTEYVQIYVKLFGIKIGKQWVEKELIRYFDPIKETIYSCNCGENNQKES